MAEKTEKPEKAVKFIDIKAPGKSTPSASSRPLVVTNRSVITNDPMVTPPAADADAPKSIEPLARTVKTIKPISTDLASSPLENETESAAVSSQESASVTTEEALQTEAGSEVTKHASGVSKVVESAPVATEIEEEPVGLHARDAEANSHAEEAKAVAAAEAEVARQEELEQLITSGKYSAPIHDAHHNRSRVIAIILCLLAIVLAAAIFDTLLDAGIVHVDGVPHTDFLKDK